jgi:hypothetical protein
MVFALCCLSKVIYLIENYAPSPSDHFDWLCNNVLSVYDTIKIGKAFILKLDGSVHLGLV